MIRIFYSAYLLSGWELICESQLQKVTQSNLYSQCDEIRVFLTGSEEQRKQFQFTFRDLGKLRYVKNDDVNQFEWPALIDMMTNYSFCNLYFHTKGITRQSECTNDWRILLDSYNILKWQLCVERLNNDFDMVGVNLLEQPRLHFSGNYFWATGKYLSRFEKETTYDFHDRLECEFVMLSKNPKTCSLFNSGINHYHDRFPLQEEPDFNK